MSEKNIVTLLLEAKADYYESLRNLRGRGFASDKEAWAEIKAALERLEKLNTTAKKLHKELWDSIVEDNDDSISAYTGEIERTAFALATEWLELAAVADMASAGREI